MRLLLHLCRGSDGKQVFSEHIIPLAGSGFRVTKIRIYTTGHDVFTSGVAIMTTGTLSSVFTREHVQVAT